MLSGTFLAVISPEGWLDPEAHESDLRGSRGVAVAGGLLIFMGVANFRNTARPCELSRIQPACRIMTRSPMLAGFSLVTGCQMPPCARVAVILGAHRGMWKESSRGCC